VTTDFRIAAENRNAGARVVGLTTFYFLSVRRHPKHANRIGLPFAANVPFVDLELDCGRCRKRAAAVLLILDL